MSSMNVSEVVSELNFKLSLPVKILYLIPKIHPFNKELSIKSELLKQAYSHLELSLGDRACLALASHLSLPVYTADKHGVHIAQKMSGKASISQIFRYTKPSQSKIDNIAQNLNI